jgi:hypothetical protein
MSNDWKVGMNIVGNLFEEMKIYGSYEVEKFNLFSLIVRSK